ncbi:MAG: metal ABC transporter ATP-binding protein [Alphaproteobacteria bacterium]|nr:metal ABC transporter ATP-binding protein [Alphaproteobacteria bacterium]
MSESIVKVSNVDFISGKTEILKNINLLVRENSVVTIIGPNGAGKSTLLKIILGLLSPTAGTAMIKKKTTVGYMPQKLHFDLTMPMTVEYFLQLTSQEKKLTLDEVLENVAATNLRHRSMHDLSGGEFQKILLARALMSLPKLLVLDEPVQGVDIAGQKALYELLRQIQKRWKCAMVIVSHDMHMVFSASDTVICLNKHICCQGKPEAIIHNPAYVNLFGEHVFAPYKHTQHENCKHSDGEVHV